MLIKKLLHVTLSLTVIHKVVQLLPTELCSASLLNVVLSWHFGWTSSGALLIAASLHAFLSTKRQLQERSAPETPKAVWVTSERGVMCQRPSNTALFLLLWTLLGGLGTKTGGLPLSLHQLTSLSQQGQHPLEPAPFLDCCSTWKVKRLDLTTGKDGICVLLCQHAACTSTNPNWFKMGPTDRD